MVSVLVVSIMLLSGVLAVSSQNAPSRHHHLRAPTDDTASVEKQSIPQYADPTAWLASGAPAMEALNEPPPAVQLPRPKPGRVLAERSRRLNQARAARRSAPPREDAWTSMTLGYNETPLDGRPDPQSPENLLFPPRL
jgi:hypothetical protein